MANKRITSVKDTIGVRQAAYLESKWKRNINAVNKAIPVQPENLAARRDQNLRLAMVLENTDREIKSFLRKNEGASQVPDVGPFRMHVFDMITAMYPNSIAEELVSVQAMPQKIAQIFFLSVLRGETKGNITEGDAVFSPWTGAADYTRYDSEYVDGEFVGTAGDKDYEGFLQFVPVRKGQVSFNIEGTAYTDDGNGNIKNGGTTVGTIDYATGKYTLSLASNTTQDIMVDYMYDQEYAPSRTGSIKLTVEETILTARPHKLNALYSFDAGYDLQSAYGLNIDDALLEAATAEIRHERDGIVINSLYRQAKNSTSWNITIPVGLNYKEHYESFINELFKCGTRINQETKRGIGNWAVVGKTGLDTLRAVGAPRFIGVGNLTTAGPQLAGTLDNQMKIFYDPFLDEDSYLVGYKGNLFLDAGFVLGDYLPLFASQMVMLEDFMGRRGYASLYGTRMINNGMYVKGTITRLPAPVPTQPTT